MRWPCIVTLDGRDFYLGPHGTQSSKREYDRLVGEWQANGRRLPNQDGTSLTITELCADYWRFAKSYYVKNSRPTDEQACIKSAIKPLRSKYGRTPAVDFGPLSLEAVRQDMVKTGNSRGYINKSISRIRRMFRWAAAKQKIPVDVLQAVIPLRCARSIAHAQNYVTSDSPARYRERELRCGCGTIWKCYVR